MLCESSIQLVCSLQRGWHRGKSWKVSGTSFRGGKRTEEETEWRSRGTIFKVTWTSSGWTWKNKERERELSKRKFNADGSNIKQHAAVQIPCNVCFGEILSSFERKILF